MHYVGGIFQHTTFTRLPSWTGSLATIHYEVQPDGTTRKCITGKKDELRNSQSYPQDFGRAWAKLYNSHKGEIKANASSEMRALEREELVDLDELMQTTPADVWEEASLGPVFQHLLALVPYVHAWCR